MIEEKKKTVIIVKKRKPTHHTSGHSGSWKIAYADFMTAMMTFFLVMWFLATSTPQQRQSLVNYLSEPIKMSLGVGHKDNNSDSPIPGGGDDPTQQTGEVHKTTSLGTGGSEQIRLQQVMAHGQLRRLRQRLLNMIQLDPRLKEIASSLRIYLTDDGLLIQIVDKDNKPMFALGSAKLSSAMIYILQKLAPVINSVPNRITISGHTDSKPYLSGNAGYSNWELSADRANAARRELVTNGLAKDKVLRVVSMADTVNVENLPSNSALNRRISIMILTPEKEKAILSEDQLQSVIASQDSFTNQINLKTPEHQLKHDGNQPVKSSTTALNSQGTKKAQSTATTLAGNTMTKEPVGVLSANHITVAKTATATHSNLAAEKVNGSHSRQASPPSQLPVRQQQPEAQSIPVTKLKKLVTDLDESDKINPAAKPNQLTSLSHVVEPTHIIPPAQAKITQPVISLSKLLPTHTATKHMLNQKVAQVADNNSTQRATSIINSLVSDNGLTASH